MFFLLVVSFFSILINFSFFINDEVILLCIFFLLFFTLLYIIFKGNFKNYVILKILQIFLIFLILFRINFNYNKILSFFLIIKKKLFIRLRIKLNNLKYIINSILVYIFNKYKILINIVFLYYSYNIKFIKNFLNLNIINIKDSIINYDNSLFY
jgi:hypothetical protein